jgi:hypothetical protein
MMGAHGLAFLEVSPNVLTAQAYLIVGWWILNEIAESWHELLEKMMRVRDE